MRKTLFILSILLSQGLRGQVVEIDMVSLMNGNLLLENGSFTNIWGYTYADQSPQLELPSPLVLLQEGDTVAFSMENLSAEGHTIHLHGLDVNQENDGVPQTSFFVPFGGTGVYNFRADKPGTFLYHCHVTTTLHLTMGMYGMLVVERPDQTLYDGGPSYDDSFYFLASDLEVATNDNPNLAYPFHEISPDYFMVNGKSGSMLFDGDENLIEVAAGESVVIRLANIAYAKTRFIFPEGSNATIHMSDGRALPQPLMTDTLEVYPGERFTVLIQPDEEISDYVFVDYFNMENGTLDATNAIGINTSIYPLGIEEYSELSVKTYPNPTSGTTVITGLQGDQVLIMDAYGKMLERRSINSNDMVLDLSNYPDGVYFLKDDLGTHSIVKISQ